MPKVELTQLIEAGAHFGHLTRRWNPKMKPYIFMEKKGIHIIDLKKTQESIHSSAGELNKIVADGKSVLFVGTKKQAKGVIAEQAKRCESNWVSERWLGGMLTNFQTIRKSIKRLQNIDKMESDGTFEKITKKERLLMTRERDKLRKVLDGVESMSRLPGALFVVDIKKEAIAVKEAQRLNIPIFAIVDTNCDPDEVDYLIPANDDAVSTVELIVKVIADEVLEGQKKAKELKAEETAEKERQKKLKEEETAGENKGKTRVRKVRFDSKGAKKSEVTEVIEDKKETEKVEAETGKTPETKTEEVKETTEVKAEKAEEKKEETAKAEEKTENEVTKEEVKDENKEDSEEKK